MQIDLKQCCMALATAEDVLILCHKSPDGDTVGSAYGLCYALQSLGKRAAVACSDPLPGKFSYFYPAGPTPAFAPQFVVAVDVADPLLLGEKLSGYADRVDLCIDHHVSNTGYATHLLLDSKAAATAEIIYRIITSMGVTLGREMATALYTGIATDTGCFRYSNTTAQTHQVAARLIETGIDHAQINSCLFETKSLARMELERLTMASLEYHFDRRCAVITLTQEMLHTSGALEEDIDGISALPRQIEGVEAAVTIRERVSGEYKLSLRTARGVNATAICRSLGGGGHPAAAGCTLQGTLPEVKATILAAVGRELEGVSR